MYEVCVDVSALTFSEEKEIAGLMNHALRDFKDITEAEIKRPKPHGKTGRNEICVTFSSKMKLMTKSAKKEVQFATHLTASMLEAYKWKDFIHDATFRQRKR